MRDTYAFWDVTVFRNRGGNARRELSASRRSRFPGGAVGLRAGVGRRGDREEPGPYSRPDERWRGEHERQQWEDVGQFELPEAMAVVICDGDHTQGLFQWNGTYLARSWDAAYDGACPRNRLPGSTGNGRGCLMEKHTVRASESTRAARVGQGNGEKHLLQDICCFHGHCHSCLGPQIPCRRVHCRAKRPWVL